jgi:chaperonin GroES
MRFRPLHDRVAVRRVTSDEKTAGGIIIPDTAKEKPSEGEVLAVGPGGRDEAGKLIPLDVKVGDRVLFGKWSGTEVKIDGEEILIMKESDILGVMEKERRQEGRLSDGTKPRPEEAAQRPSRRTRPQSEPSSFETLASPLLRTRGISQFGDKRCPLKKSNSQSKRATRCCAASTPSPMR